MQNTLPEPSINDVSMTAILAALADPARRSIMRVMFQGPEPFDCRASTWCEALGITAPTLSHHFRTLREAGLTRTVVDGRTRTISARREDVDVRFPGLLQAVLDPEERTVDLPMGGGRSSVLHEGGTTEPSPDRRQPPIHRPTNLCADGSPRRSAYSGGTSAL